MPSKLLVTSKSNLDLIRQSKLDLFNHCEVLVVEKPPHTHNMRKFKGTVIAMGGGSVIDTAKIIANPEPCYVIPTNACGSVSTSHACVWNKEKIDIKTPFPIFIDLYKRLPIKLSKEAWERTATDCFCHIEESYHSKKATIESRMLSELARVLLFRANIKNDVSILIEAGNIAGKAIEITGTNIIHAISYVLTLEEGLCHGDALKEAMNLRNRKDAKRITLKAAKNYPKYFESYI